MPRMKKRIYSGVVCEQIVYTIGDRVRDKSSAKPKTKELTKEQKEEHKKAKALRLFTRKINANFTPRGYFVTLTMDRENELHDFDEARAVRSNFCRRLKYHFKDIKIVMVMGRGKSTSRIHFHALIEGENIQPKDIEASWTGGKITRIDHLRTNCKISGIEVGPDYTAVAHYMFAHWTKDQGGHYSFQTKNLEMPIEEAPTECVRDYTEEHPPIEPKGYKYIGCTEPNNYGYMIFKYVKKSIEPLRKRGRAKQAVLYQ